MENIFVEFLPPWVLTGRQPAFYDKESGTCLQQTARMYDRVNMLIRMFNKLSKNTKDEIESFETTTNETVEEYIGKFNDLHDYVMDYFDNLDVQEEINNKLDDLVEDGTMQTLINNILQPNVTWTFDTVADMKLSTNLVDGGYAQTLGFSSINDGGGAIYYISNTGSADEKTVIAVGSLYANLLAQNVMNIKQFGAKCDGSTDDSSTISTAIYWCNGKTSKLVFPDSLIYTENPIVLTGVENMTFEFGNRIHRKSSDSTSFGFNISACKNIVFNNLDIYSERDQTESAPAGHTRVSTYGSNIMGVFITKSSNLVFNNSKFQYMASDFFNQKPSDSSDLSYDITINGWYSRDTSMNLFMQYVNNVNINNADLIPAEDMGDGDHFVYFSKYVDGVNITNCKFVSPDTNFGVAITPHATGDDASNLNCPKNVFINNCYFYLYAPALYTGHITDILMTNCKIVMNNSLKQVFYFADNAEVKIDCCTISGSYKTIYDAYNNGVFYFTNNIVKNSADSYDQAFYTSSSAGFTTTIYVENNIFLWDNPLFYGHQNTIVKAVFENNILKQHNAKAYAFRFMNESSDVIINKNTISNTNQKNYCILNEHPQSSMRVYFNDIKGYTNLANATDITTISNDYNVVV